MKKLLMAAALSIFLTGCGGSKIRQIPVTHSNELVHRIAVNPSSGVLGDAVSVILEADGYNIIDSADTTNLLVRSGIQESETYLPISMKALREQGVDAILGVRAVGGKDNNPEGAVAKITSTTSGSVISGVTWQNGWGGRAGSIADRSMRRGLSEAATEIAKGLEINMSKSTTQ